MHGLQSLIHSSIHFVLKLQESVIGQKTEESMMKEHERTCMIDIITETEQ